ncbi:MAG: caspase family protein [Polyangiaceae bacterium]|nr:caspase family protein [Polyangiaceae bacterium]
MTKEELEVTWKGRETSLVFREEGDEIKGYVGKKHVLTVELSDGGEVDELFCHEDLEYDEEDLADLLLADEEGGEDEEEDDEEGEDEEEDDEEEEDESDQGEEDAESEEAEEDSGDEIDEDEDANYGDPVKTAKIPGVPTLHAVLVAYGADIGVDDDVRLTRDFFRMLQAEKVLNVKETLLAGRNATAEKALAAVQAFQPGEDDVVWFSYSGHGAMAEGDRLLCTRGKMLRRAAVSEAMQALGARFGVVLSDCCADEMGRVSPKETLGAARPTRLTARMNRLFRQYTGMFDVTSSADYQYSFGGVFTPTLIKKVLFGSSEDTWEGVLERTVKITMADGEGAMSKEGRRALRKVGEVVIEAQKPVAYAMPHER